MFFWDDATHIRECGLNQARDKIDTGFAMEEHLAAVGRYNHLNCALTWQDACKFGQRACGNKNAAMSFIVTWKRRFTYGKPERIGGGEGNLFVADLDLDTCEDGT